MQLRIGHIYPAQMNIYGDRGNIIALQQRCAWRNVAYEVTAIQPGMQVAKIAANHSSLTILCNATASIYVRHSAMAW